MVFESRNGSNKFFRQRILTQSLVEIREYVKHLEKEERDIKKDLFKICWYRRGMSYEGAMMLSYDERMIIGEIIKENLETTKKTKLPFF